MAATVAEVLRTCTRHELGDTTACELAADELAEQARQAVREGRAASVAWDHTVYTPTYNGRPGNSAGNGSPASSWASFRRRNRRRRPMPAPATDQSTTTSPATDPLAFRLNYLSGDPRATGVLNAMAKQAGWQLGISTPGPGMGRGMRVVVAHDCGLIINPDGLRNHCHGIDTSVGRA